MKEVLTLEILKEKAKLFAELVSQEKIKNLFGITDGKAIGTYLEHKFKEYLSLYDFELGSSSLGIDFPSKEINTDIKVTSVKQPQSSCPFKNVTQKIYGLGYNILLFVYDKIDDNIDKTAQLNIVNCSFIENKRTGDYTLTYRLNEMIKDNANKEDIISYLQDRNIPADDITLEELAEKILFEPPLQGYLTISNALQWRLQYQRIVSLTDNISGITTLINKAK